MASKKKIINCNISHSNHISIDFKRINCVIFDLSGSIHVGHFTQSHFLFAVQINTAHEAMSYFQVCTINVYFCLNVYRMILNTSHRMTGFLLGYNSMDMGFCVNKLFDIACQFRIIIF